MKAKVIYFPNEKVKVQIYKTVISNNGQNFL